METWRIRLLASGTANVAWEVESATRQLIVRAMSPNNAKKTTYAEEFAILQILHDEGIPVPQAIASSVGHLAIHIDNINFDWSITSKIAGKAVGNRQLSLQTKHQVGHFLACLHAIPVTAYGNLTLTDTGFSGNQQSPLAGAKQQWQDYPMWGVHEHVRLETTVIASMFPEHIPQLKSLEKQVWEAVSEGESVICHGDLHSGHVFLKEDSLSGIIDFGDVCVLSPAWDFAIAAHYFGWQSISDILDAYTSSTRKKDQLFKQAYRLGLIVGVFKLQRQFVRRANVVARARTLQFIRHTLNRLNLR